MYFPAKNFIWETEFNPARIGRSGVEDNSPVFRDSVIPLKLTSGFSQDLLPGPGEGFLFAYLLFPYDL